MDLKLKDKRALVTGSTAGIGLAVTRGTAREGAGQRAWFRPEQQEKIARSA